MVTLQIRGVSDDCIRVSGPSEWTFLVALEGYEDYALIGFSDGTVLRAWSDFDDCWRFFRLKKGTASFSKVEPEEPNPGDTDVVTLCGDDLKRCHLLRSGEEVPGQAFSLCR